MDISSLSNQMVAAQTLGGLLLAWPQENIGIQPQTKLYGGKAGTTEKFLFHYEGEQSVSFDDDISDHYIEDNSAMQDHIALAPAMIRTIGYIGELNNVTPESLTALKQAAEKLQPLGSYAPQLSASAQIAYNKAFQAYQAIKFVDSNLKIPSFSKLGGAQSKKTSIINSAASADEYVANVDFGSQNQQQVAFQKFYGYRKARTLFTVQTPWAIFKDCAIKSMDVNQDETTKMVSSFSITFKPIRFAQTRFTNSDLTSNYQGRAYFQAAPLEDSGMSAVNFSESPFPVLTAGV